MKYLCVGPFSNAIPDAFISSLYLSLLLENRALWTPLQQLLQCLSDRDQRAFFDGMLLDLVRKYLRNPFLQNQYDQNGLENQAAIGGVAAMVAGLVQGNKVLEEHIERWLTTTTGEYANLGLDTRRAVVATLGLRQGRSCSALTTDSDFFQTSYRRFLKSVSRTLAISSRFGTIQSYSKSVSDQLKIL